MSNSYFDTFQYDVFSNAKKPIGTNQGVNLGTLHVVELLHGLKE